MSGIRFLSSFLLAAVFVLISSADHPRHSKLTRALTGRNEAVRMRALASVNHPAVLRSAVDDLIVAVQWNIEETDPDELVRHSTVALIYSIGRLDEPRVEEVLIEALDSPHLGISMVAADVLGKNKFYDAIGALEQQVSRPEYAENYGFRFNLVRALAQMEHPDAVDVLTELRSTLDGQLRFQIESLLEEVTVGHFLGDQQRYEQWKENKGDQREGMFQAASFEPESLQRMRLTRNQYYGIDIHAKRLMFIIDHSGSMKQYWGGATRLERAKSELIRAIDELPEDSEFAIIFYHTNVRQWRDDLQAATEENKREAIQFVRRLGYGNKTNTYGALLESLQFDNDLEAVFLLTDGRPTAGNIIAHDGIIADVLHRNRFRHLNFNTIGIGVSGTTARFLRRLATESNGEFRMAK